MPSVLFGKVIVDKKGYMCGNQFAIVNIDYYMLYSLCYMVWLIIPFSYFAFPVNDTSRIYTKYILVLNYCCMWFFINSLDVSTIERV